MGGLAKQEAEAWGRAAEDIAADYLRGLGYTIREQRWKMGQKAEIDLIAQIEDNIVLVEVKARSGRHTAAVDSVDNAKMRQMVRAADSYIGKLDKPFYYRFDIITLTGSPDSFELQHYPNAFLAPLSGIR